MSYSIIFDQPVCGSKKKYNTWQPIYLKTLGGVIFDKEQNQDFSRVSFATFPEARNFVKELISTLQPVREGEDLLIFNPPRIKWGKSYGLYHIELTPEKVLFTVGKKAVISYRIEIDRMAQVEIRRKYTRLAPKDLSRISPNVFDHGLSQAILMQNSEERCT